MNDLACGCDIQRYCLLSDDDGHYYLCPLERRHEASAILEDNDRYWSSAERRHTDSAGPTPVPDYLIYVDNHYSLSFENPKENP
jgi:hypothetical protein